LAGHAFVQCDWDLLRGCFSGRSDGYQFREAGALPALARRCEIADDLRGGERNPRTGWTAWPDRNGPDGQAMSSTKAAFSEIAA
jgi:hypothetical protein